MLEKTAQYIQAHQMLLPGAKVVIGLSGGMDSVCLFHVLKKLGYSLEAVHVNHGIRGEEAKRDEEFVKMLCMQYDIPIHVYFFDVPAMSKELHLSVEETGRMVRRKAFAEVKSSCGAERIALAHHGNDRAETFLFHLCRGTGMKGLASMKPVQDDYIRPFLWAQREEIENYVKRNYYMFQEDSTNQELCYTRNRMRHQVIPVLGQINSKSVSHICSAAEKIRAAAEYMDREAEKLFQKSVTIETGKVSISKKELFRGDSLLRIPVLQKGVEAFSGSLADFGETHFRRLEELFDMQTGKELVLPGPVRAVRTYEGIMLCRKEKRETLKPLKIHGAGVYTFGECTFHVSVETWNHKENFPTNHYTKCFDYDKIRGDIFLRTRAPGDYLEINRQHGRKILQDYLVNEKVPKEQRDGMILLAEGSHILWVVGKRISEYYKITKETRRILKIQISGGKNEEFYS